MKEKLLQISSSWGMCAGLVLLNGEVIETAPILHYMLFWKAKKVFSYCKKRGFVITYIRR